MACVRARRTWCRDNRCEATSGKRSQIVWSLYWSLCKNQKNQTAPCLAGSIVHRYDRYGVHFWLRIRMWCARRMQYTNTVVRLLRVTVESDGDVRMGWLQPDGKRGKKSLSHSLVHSEQGTVGSICLRRVNPGSAEEVRAREHCDCHSRQHRPTDDTCDGQLRLLYTSCGRARKGRVDHHQNRGGHEAYDERDANAAR